MGLLDLVFPGKTKMEVAANIINAEYNLCNIHPHLTIKAFKDVTDKLWKGYNRDSPEDAFSYFLEMPRNLQLNILALAYNNTSTAPLINGEYWTYVKNPILPQIYDQKILFTVYRRIQKQYDVDIEMSSHSITKGDLEMLFV
jgi:hypothetical protein